MRPSVVDAGLLFAAGGHVANDGKRETGEGREDQQEPDEAGHRKDRGDGEEDHGCVDHEGHDQQAEIAVRGGRQADHHVAQRYDGAVGYARAEPQHAKRLIVVHHGAKQVADHEHTQGAVEQVTPVHAGDQNHHQKALHGLAGVLRGRHEAPLHGAESQLADHAVHERRLQDHRLRAHKVQKHEGQQHRHAVDVDCPVGI